MAETNHILLAGENMAPIEQAHLLRGFSAKKTPLKWIRFFRLCVMQREVGQKALNKKLRNMWIILAILGAIATVILLPFSLFAIIPLVIVGAIFNYRFKKEFNEKYSDGYDFFASYFTALFTLMEEEMPFGGVISLKANVKNTISPEFLKSSNDAKFETSGFISGKEEFYEKEIAEGICELRDGAEANFSFVEVLRSRIINKYGTSGKRKTKYKYKTTYPFVLKLKIPKNTYSIKPELNLQDVHMEEDSDFYYMKAKRKFDIKEERPEDYSPYMYNSIQLFSVDYFTLEVMNLLNICYGCFTLKNAA